MLKVFDWLPNCDEFNPNRCVFSYQENQPELSFLNGAKSADDVEIMSSDSSTSDSSDSSTGND